jgi:hypothetical protein
MPQLYFIQELKGGATKRYKNEKEVYSYMG